MFHVGKLTDKKEQAVKDGLSAELFIGDDDNKHLEACIRKAIEKAGVKTPYLQHLLELLDETKDVSFSETAELWEMIVVLLRYIAFSSELH